MLYFILFRQILPTILFWNVCGFMPMVSFILHYQCVKFFKDGEVKKVNVDLNSFQGDEVNNADAKFYKSAN